MGIVKTILVAVFMSTVVFVHGQFILMEDEKIISHQDTIDEIDNSELSRSSLEWLNNGNIHYASNGFLHSSANMIKLNLGDPQKLNIPMYLMIGASLDVKEGNELFNEAAAFEILNQNGGLLNIGINGYHPIHEFSSAAGINLHYRLSYKSISGATLETGLSENFFSRMSSLGIVLNTMVWNPENPEKKGTSWLSVDFSHSQNPEDIMQSFFGRNINAGVWLYHLSGGVELVEYLNVQFGYYQTLNNSDHHIFGTGILKLAADFKLN